MEIGWVNFQFCSHMIIYKLDLVDLIDLVYLPICEAMCFMM